MRAEIRGFFWTIPSVGIVGCRDHSNRASRKNYERYCWPASTANRNIIFKLISFKPFVIAFKDSPVYQKKTILACYLTATPLGIGERHARYTSFILHNVICVRLL